MRHRIYGLGMKEEGFFRILVGGEYRLVFGMPEGQTCIV